MLPPTSPTCSASPATRLSNHLACLRDCDLVRFGGQFEGAVPSAHGPVRQDGPVAGHALPARARHRVGRLQRGRGRVYGFPATQQCVDRSTALKEDPGVAVAAVAPRRVFRLPGCLGFRVSGGLLQRAVSAGTGPAWAGAVLGAQALPVPTTTAHSAQSTPTLSRAPSRGRSEFLRVVD